MVKLTLGVGINDRKYPMKIQGKRLKESDLWNDLLKRCYSHSVQRNHPTYLGCSASENFKSYSYFYEWCQNQIGFGQENYHLDKDLLFKGNKLYSEDTCLFLPSSLNLLLLTSKKRRGLLPLGVSLQGNRFKSDCRTEAPNSHIGYFDTPEEAFQAYKQAKENYVKTQAEKWKALIDPRAYAALMAYEVSIAD